MSADTPELLGLAAVARLVTIVRVAVVASVAVLLLYGSPPVRSTRLSRGRSPPSPSYTRWRWCGGWTGSCAARGRPR